MKSINTPIPELALRFVNLLVPAAFAEAETWLSAACRYDYQGIPLEGPAVLEAFKDSHKRAERELDHIEYLPGEIREIYSDGALIGVADRISLNGKTHTYRDRLLVRLREETVDFKVCFLQHLPIAEEREKLKAFLESAGPRKDF